MKTKIIFLALLSLSFFGCGPRGETRSLDQVYSTAKENFDTLLASNANEDVKSKLNEINSSIEKITGTSGKDLLKSEANNLAEQLSDVVTDMGYTQRPAIGEIINQYRALSEESVNAVPTTDEIKLLAARTFMILSSELESINFKLGERERKG